MDELVDEIAGYDSTLYAANHSSQTPTTPTTDPPPRHRRSNGHFSPSEHLYATDLDTQPIHPPHQDWQHSGNLQDMQNVGNIEKLSQEVGRLSLQLNELMGQFQSLRSSVTVVNPTLPPQFTSPARVHSATDDTAVTHDLNDQLLRSHIQERLAEKLKQLLIAN